MSRKSTPSFLSLLPLAVLLCLAVAPGQVTPPPVEAQDPVQARRQAEAKAMAATLERMRTAIEDKEREIREAPKKLEAITDAAARAKEKQRLDELALELQKARADFQALATGVEVSEFEQAKQAEAKLLEEIERLLRPLVQELKDASKDLRQTARQRAEIEHHAQRKATADRALDGLRRLLEQPGSDLTKDTRDDLLELRDEWQRRRNDAHNQEAIAKHQLETRLANREPLLESSRRAVGRFFETRGLHILMALGAFVVVFFGLRFVARPFRRIARRRGGPSMRVFSVLFQLFVAVFAVIAALAALYVADDWGLLGLALLLLFGLAWASKEAAPRFFDQIRLMLGVGAVREGERIVLHGVPWRVGRINLFTRMSNPELAGSLRVPIKELVDQRSRAVATGESWFPCRVGDWVIVDGTRGKVLEQSVDVVRIVQLGGAQITYQTAAFLGLNPMNLSVDFRVALRFGVDYAHQAICTTEIPAQMQRRLQSELFEMLGENLASVGVQFASAGASSLDYEVMVDVRGAAAKDYSRIERATQRILVDACNAHGWVIPFQQVTVHQAV